MVDAAGDHVNVTAIAGVHGVDAGAAGEHVGDGGGLVDAEAVVTGVAGGGGSGASEQEVGVGAGEGGNAGAAGEGVHVAAGGSDGGHVIAFAVLHHAGEVVGSGEVGIAKGEGLGAGGSQAREG